MGARKMTLRYPRVRKHILVVPYENTISIGNTLQSAIEVEDTTGVIYDILKLCDGKKCINDIYDEIIKKYTDIEKSDIEEIIDSISEYPYIFEDGDLDSKHNISDKLLERHSRNINFLSNFDADGNNKYDYLQKLLDSKIMIFGLGGVGSPLIYNLAALGVGEIIGVDFDSVDLTNLNRQILYREDQIGMKKVIAAGETIKKFNSNVNFVPVDMTVKSSEDVLKLINKFNPTIVICAADKPPLWIYKWINEACMITDKPWIFGGNSETTSYFQTIIPHKTSCFECKQTYLNENECKDGLNKYKAILANGYDTENNCTSASSSALASFVTFDALRIITGCGEPMSINKRTFIDYKTNLIETEEALRASNCKCCSMKGGEIE